MKRKRRRESWHEGRKEVGSRPWQLKKIRKVQIGTVEGDSLSSEELHSEQREDEDEEEKQKEQGDDGPHAVQQRDDQVP